MRGKVSKRLRRSAYGKGHHPMLVEYFIGDPKRMGLHKNLRGCCVSDEQRRAYQALKRAFRRGEFVLR
jgi:hypothetical protein